jgi:dephospho-CoA kinase
LPEWPKKGLTSLTEVGLIQAGLTGGIATGKSTVSGIFRQAGAFIIDADDIAHRSIRKGMAAWWEVVTHFGHAILRSDGEINRPLLGSIIFKEEEKKQILNQIVHPHVRREIARQLAPIEKNHPRAVIILDIPLLIEVGWHRDVQEVILVYAPEEIQLNRLMARDGLSNEDALARIRAQMPIEEKKRQASIVIDNSGDLEITREKTLAVYDYLKREG